MPITCPISFPQISTEEFQTLDYKVMGLAFASHREIGRLADERVYQVDLAARLLEAGLKAQREVPITVTFQTFTKTYVIDAIAEMAATRSDCLQSKGKKIDGKNIFSRLRASPPILHRWEDD